MTKRKQVTNSTAIKIGAVGATIAGLAAGYFFLGPKGKKHQRQTKAWAIKMKGEVVHKLEQAREVSEPIYQEIVDSVAGEYQRGKMAGKIEINELAQDLKKHWKTLGRGLRTIKFDVKSGVGKVAKLAKL